MLGPFDDQEDDERCDGMEQVPRLVILHLNSCDRGKYLLLVVLQLHEGRSFLRQAQRMNTRRANRSEERQKVASKDCLPEEPTKRKTYDITRTSACDPPRNNPTQSQISVYDRIVEVNGQRASGKELASSPVLASWSEDVG